MKHFEFSLDAFSTIICTRIYGKNLFSPNFEIFLWIFCTVYAWFSLFSPIYVNPSTIKLFYLDIFPHLLIYFKKLFSGNNQLQVKIIRLYTKYFKNHTILLDPITYAQQRVTLFFHVQLMLKHLPLSLL